MLGFDCETDIGSFTPFYEGLREGTPVLFDIPGMPPILSEEVENRLRLATEWVEEGVGVRPDPFLVQNCGPGAAEELNRLVELLGARGATFHQAKHITT